MNVAAKGAKQFRAVSAHLATAANLGPLQELPGFWEGVGFNLIARPDYSGGGENGLFLAVNLLRESIEFTTIGSPVINRGSLQDDIAIYGVTYLHRVTDATTGSALHIEPGMWLNIPPTTEPASDASIARLATIPHGNAVSTVGFSEDVVFQGLPTIPPANTVPFKIGETPPPAGTKNPFPEYDLSIPTKYRDDPLPAGITQALVDDPNVMLRDAIKDQKLTKIIRLITSTTPAGGIENIPFIVSNADTPSFESVFAIRDRTGLDGSRVPAASVLADGTAEFPWDELPACDRRDTDKSVLSPPGPNAGSAIDLVSRHPAALPGRALAEAGRSAAAEEAVSEPPVCFWVESRSRALWMKAKCENACGKLPSISLVWKLYSSMNRPRSLAHPRRVSNRARASSVLPARARFWTIQKLQMMKVPSPPARPSSKPL